MGIELTRQMLKFGCSRLEVPVIRVTGHAPCSRTPIFVPTAAEFNQCVHRNASPRPPRDRKTHIMRESSFLTRKAVVKHL